MGQKHEICLTLHICLPAALPCNITSVSQLWATCPWQFFTLSFVSRVSQLWTAVSASALQSFTFVSQLWAAVSASALQSFTFVSQCWAAVSASALQSVLASLLHLSTSSRLLSPPLPCNPLFVTQLWAACRLQSFTVVSLCLHLSPSSGLMWLVSKTPSYGPLRMAPKPATYDFQQSLEICLTSL